jgi:hypothetical protein
LQNFDTAQAYELQLQHTKSKEGIIHRSISSRIVVEMLNLNQKAQQELARVD